MNMGMFQAITDIVLHGNFFINVFNQNKHNLTKPNLTYPSLKVSKQNNFQKNTIDKNLSIRKTVWLRSASK